MIKARILSFTVGFVGGLLFFFGPALTVGQVGVLGIELLAPLFPNSIVGLYLIGLPYAVVLGTVLFFGGLLLFRRGDYDKLSVSRLLLSWFGVYLAYYLIVWLFLATLSRGVFGL